MIFECCYNAGYASECNQTGSVSHLNSVYERYIKHQRSKNLGILYYNSQSLIKGTITNHYLPLNSCMSNPSPCGKIIFLWHSSIWVTSFLKSLQGLPPHQEQVSGAEFQLLHPVAPFWPFWFITQSSFELIIDFPELCSGCPYSLFHFLHLSVC